jgi:cytidine deaminase
MQILFGHPFRTPTRDEHAMFLAKAASLRSADLSRHVGAVIVDGSGDEVASGCNEVPKFGGGIFYEDDSTDQRDFQMGADPNRLVQREMVHEIVDIMKEKGLAIVDARALESALEGSRLLSTVEFGRIVHAEMNALSAAARRGAAVGGGKLYCTTFPCHVCARHLLAAGIREVVFIEPYPKSMALRLYEDAIVMDDSSSESKLVFRPFIGVAPRRYIDFFSFRRRKDREGYAVRWQPKGASPTGATGTQYILTEQSLTSKLAEKMKTLGWA